MVVIRQAADAPPSLVAGVLARPAICTIIGMPTRATLTHGMETVAPGTETVTGTDMAYPNNYYPDNGYSGQNGSASIQALVQDSLARRGYYDGPVDGVVGSGTRSAIREFQRDNGLPVTGRIDSQLVQTLQIGRD